ncbi:MAG TPA: response regulator [Gemmataceae bacterium]|nr:response regulator [Gemmataceae bacterium]
MATERKTRILIIEDDPGVARLQQRCLERAGFEVVIAHTATSGLRMIRLGAISLLVLDYKLPEMDGLQLYERIKNSGQEVPVILVTAFSDEATAIQALRAGVRDIVIKSPQYLDYLPDAVKRVLSHVHLERQFAQSEARLAVIIDSARDAIVTIDADRRITLFSRAAENMFGCQAEDALGQAIDRFIPGAGYGEMALVTPLAGPVSPCTRQAELYGVRADGQQFPVELSMSTAELERRSFSVLIVRDITERKKAESHAHLVQRMESISTLAGGIGHDLNNVLTPILMGVELLEGSEAEAASPTLLDHMKRSAQRGAEMAKQLLSLATHAEGDGAPANLPTIPQPGHPATGMALPGCGELILIVDDEVSIGEMTKTILEAHGYRAITASSGAEAVASFSRYREEIEVVLVDMIMPVMDGRATAQSLRRLEPRVRIITMSGLPAGHKAPEATRPGAEIFLAKPYRKETLLSALHELLKGTERRSTSRPRQVASPLPPDVSACAEADMHRRAETATDARGSYRGRAAYFISPKIGSLPGDREQTSPSILQIDVAPDSSATEPVSMICLAAAPMRQEVDDEPAESQGRPSPRARLAL